MITHQKNETKGIIPVLDVPTEIYERLQKRAKEQGIDIGQVIADLIAEKHNDIQRSMTEQETKPENVETVNVTLTVPLPVDFYKMLKGLSEITGLSVETMLTDDLFQILTSYFSGDYFNSWVEWVVEQKGKGITGGATEDIEKGLETVRAALF